MPLLDRVLELPCYGFRREGKLYVPTPGELIQEFVSRLDVRRNRKNWLPLWVWFTSCVLVIPLFCFLAWHFSWGLLLLGLTYSMVALGTHGTVWFHRHCTHRAFSFSSPLWREVSRNLVIKLLPEEVYVVSHHVHHRMSERPGDPYNVHGGWLYCFLADVNHQLIARDLSQRDYESLKRLMSHTGVRLNSYAQYLRWGSLCHPGFTVAHYVANWVFWYAVFFALGGHALATAIFGTSFLWAFGVRTFNFGGHGAGNDRRREGIDFNRTDLSVNQLWPGYVSGEWHNNHHLYPNSARAGFLPHQLDLAWIFIRSCAWLGAVSSYRDCKAQFLASHYLPYLSGRRALADIPIPNGE